MSEENDADTIKVEIFIGGYHREALRVCREWCGEVGACITVQAIEYIHAGNDEAGIRVRLVNDPDFPSDLVTMRDRARELADNLRTRFCRCTYEITGGVISVWHSNHWW